MNIHRFKIQLPPRSEQILRQGHEPVDFLGNDPGIFIQFRVIDLPFQ